MIWFYLYLKQNPEQFRAQFSVGAIWRLCRICAKKKKNTNEIKHPWVSYEFSCSLRRSHTHFWALLIHLQQYTELWHRCIKAAVGLRPSSCIHWAKPATAPVNLPDINPGEVMRSCSWMQDAGSEESLLNSSFLCRRLWAAISRGSKDGAGLAEVTWRDGNSICLLVWGRNIKDAMSCAAWMLNPQTDIHQSDKTLKALTAEVRNILL